MFTKCCNWIIFHFIVTDEEVFGVIFKLLFASLSESGGCLPSCEVKLAAKLFTSTSQKIYQSSVYLTVILRGRAGYELIYITNEAVGLVGYCHLISGKSEKNTGFSKFSSNSLDFFG